MRDRGHTEVICFCVLIHPDRNPQLPAGLERRLTPAVGRQILLRMSPFWHALLFGAIVTTLAALLAFAAARLRFSVPRGIRTVLDFLFLLPLALPSPLVINFGMQYTDLSIGDIVFAVPVFYLCAVMGFRRVQPECVDAARLQGLGPCGIFWRVWFPAAWPWLAAALALGWFRNAIMWVIAYS